MISVLLVKFVPVIAPKNATKKRNAILSGDRKVFVRAVNITAIAAPIGFMNQSNAVLGCGLEEVLAIQERDLVRNVVVESQKQKSLSKKAELCNDETVRGDLLSTSSISSRGIGESLGSILLSDRVVSARIPGNIEGYII